MPKPTKHIRIKFECVLRLDREIEGTGTVPSAALMTHLQDAMNVIPGAEFVLPGAKLGLSLITQIQALGTIPKARGT